MTVRIQLRRGTAAAWTSADPVLGEGEAGLETDTGLLKFGDGTSAWSSLAYFAGSGGGAVDSVNGATGTVVLDAGDIAFTPAGSVAASDVQAAIAEVATEYAAAVTAEASTRASADTTNASAASAAQGTANAALPKAGGTMTGDIVLAGNAGASLNPTPLQQVNSLIAAAIAALVSSAPGTLDTLAEIATALTADEATAATLASTVAGKLAIASNLSDLANAATARTNLGLVIGTNVEAHDADLTTFAGLTPTNDDLLQRKAGAWANRTPAQVKTDLALSKSDVGLGSVDNTADTAKAFAASQITSGVLAIGRLATGTPDGTKFVRDDGTLAVPAGGGAVATDTVWDTKGDLAVATGADAASKLAAGTNGQVLNVDSSQTTGLKYVTLPQLYGLAGTPGTLAATYDRVKDPGIQAAGAATSGTLRLFLISLPAGLVVTKLRFTAGSTAGASLTHSWAVFMDSSRNKRAISADDTTAAWATEATREYTMTTPYTIPTTGNYYVGLCIAGTTIPTIEALAGLIAGGTRNKAPIAGGNSSTGLSTPGTCPDPAGAITVLGQVAYCEIA